MTLGEIRKQLVQLSGRYDLIDSPETYADAGANFFIQSGQRFLERRVNTDKSIARIYKQVNSGDYYISFTLARSIMRVWCVESSNSRLELEKKEFVDLRNDFNLPINTTDKGRPLYFSTTHLRSQDFTDKDIDFLDYVMESSDAYNAILFTPPADKSYIIEVWGYFYMKELQIDTDQNFWSVRYPETLIKAALLQTEIFNRNTEGTNDWLKALEFDITEIDKDVVEQEYFNERKMVG